MRGREQAVDELLVLAAQAGRAGAFDLLVARWHQRLLRHARRLTGDAEGAHEAVQEAWLAVARGLRRLDDPARFAPWLYRIVGRRCFEWIAGRRRERRRAADLDEAAHAPKEPGTDPDEVVRVREALRRLAPEPRALLAMFYAEGFSVAEIAGALGIPAGTVKSRLYHARERLRAVLEVRHDQAG